MYQDALTWILENWLLTASAAGVIISGIAKVVPSKKITQWAESTKKKLGPLCYNAGRLLTLGGKSKLKGLWEPLETFIVDGLELLIRCGSDIFDYCWTQFKEGVRSDNKPKEEKL